MSDALRTIIKVTKMNTFTNSCSIFAKTSESIVKRDTRNRSSEGLTERELETVIIFAKIIPSRFSGFTIFLVFIFSQEDWSVILVWS